MLKNRNFPIVVLIIVLGAIFILFHEFFLGLILIVIAMGLSAVM